jgi:hypothetical protein
MLKMAHHLRYNQHMTEATHLITALRSCSSTLYDDLHLRKRTANPFCPFCTEPSQQETAQHVINDCPQYNTEREKYQANLKTTRLTTQDPFLLVLTGPTTPDNLRTYERTSIDRWNKIFIQKIFDRRTQLLEH